LESRLPPRILPIGGFGLERDVADFVDDQQRVAAQPGELGLEPPGVAGLGEPGAPSADLAAAWSARVPCLLTSCS